MSVHGVAALLAMASGATSLSATILTHTSALLPHAGTLSTILTKESPPLKLQSLARRKRECTKDVGPSIGHANTSFLAHAVPLESKLAAVGPRCEA